MPFQVALYSLNSTFIPVSIFMHVYAVQLCGVYLHMILSEVHIVHVILPSDRRDCIDEGIMEWESAMCNLVVE